MFNDSLNTLISALGGDPANPKCESSSELSSINFSGKVLILHKYKINVI